LQSGKCTVGFTFLLLVPIFIFCCFAQAQDESGKAGIEDEGWASTWGCAPGFAIGQELAKQTIRQFARNQCRRQTGPYPFIQ
jgi:hypothetical protein